ncbi:MAG: hypothetical protein ACRCXZ_08550 [Patescibacteria group bacterium]
MIGIQQDQFESRSLRFDDTWSQTIFDHQYIAQWSDLPKLKSIEKLYQELGPGFMNIETGEFLNLVHFKRYSKLKINSFRYQYVGMYRNHQYDNQPIVVDTNSMTLGINSSDLDSRKAIVLLRWYDLLNGQVSERTRSEHPEETIVITSGSILALANLELWVYIDREVHFTPFAKLKANLFQMLRHRYKNQKLNSKDFYSLISIKDLLIASASKVLMDTDVLVCCGFANDLGNSKKLSSNQSSKLGSKLIDNIVWITQKPVLSGGDGSESFMWGKLGRIISRAKYLAKLDAKVVQNTNASSRTAIFLVNYFAVLDYFNDCGFKLQMQEAMKICEMVALTYTPILQTASKEITDFKSSLVMTLDSAEMFGLSGSSNIVSCLEPITKSEPKLFFSQADSHSVAFKRHKVNAAVFDASIL